MDDILHLPSGQPSHIIRSIDQHIRQVSLSRVASSSLLPMLHTVLNNASLLCHTKEERKLGKGEWGQSSMPGDRKAGIQQAGETGDIEQPNAGGEGVEGCGHVGNGPSGWEGLAQFSLPCTKCQMGEGRRGNGE